MFVAVQDKTTRLRMKKSFSGGNFLYSDTNYTDENQQFITYIFISRNFRLQHLLLFLHRPMLLF